MEVREASAAYAVTATPQVDKGYKQTEVGVIPEDWAVKPLQTLTVCLDNLRVPLNESQRARRQGDIPYCGANGVLDYIDDFVVDDDIILMAEDGGYFDEYLTRPIAYRMTGKCWVNNHAHILKANTGTDQGFIYYSLVHKNILRFLASGTRAKLNRSELNKIEVPLPPTKAEQEAIAEALSDADALIESLEHLLAKKRQVKQGAMQQLLTGKRRLPGFSGEWEVRRLGELADIRSGGTPSTTQPQFWDGDILWCTPTDITGLNGFKYLSDTSRKISPLGLKSSSAEMIPANSIVMTSRATIGECAVNAVPVSTNQGFKNFVPFDPVDAEFLYYLLLTQKQGFISLCGGSTFLEIGKTQLAGFEVPLPATKAEQTAIATLLSDMDAELAILEAKLAKARAIKQGMMQELLTGRIRLVQPASNVMPFPEKAQPTPANTGSHNKQINEAVIIGVLSKHFGTENYPLPRKRRVKLTYLLHRYTAGKAEGYLKKAAGPYDPGTKYKGPETIALKNGYVREHHNGSYPGFVAGDKIVQAERYFEKWYGTDALAWLEQFKYKKTDELELLTTVDMAMVDLAGEGRMIDLLSVKAVIAGHPEWVPKLSREIFSDANIERAISVCKDLFG